MFTKQTQSKQSGMLNLQIVMFGFFFVLSLAFGSFWLAKSDDNPPRSSLQSATQISAGASERTASANQTAETGEFSAPQTNAGSERVAELSGRTVSQSAEEIGFTTGAIAKSPDGLSVDVSSGLPKPSTGNCDFVFTINTLELRENKSISNAEACELSVPVIEFPAAGSYTVAISFVSSDAQEYAFVEGLGLDVEPIEFAFTQGGGVQSGELITVTVSGKNSYSGTCTYTFTLGTTILETSNTITNSNACQINLPRSEFPEPGPWLLDVSFEGSDALVVGRGQGFVVPIN